MSTFRENLRRLFSRNIIIKRLPGDRLRTFDVSLSQAHDGSSQTMRYDRYRFRNGRGTNSVTGWGTNNVTPEIESMRLLMYADYDEMDRDAILHSALDIYADEATTKDTSGNMLAIKTSDERIRKVLYNLFYDVLNIEYNLWSLIRSACKYGDAFWYLDIREEYGVVNVVPIHPALILRLEGVTEDPNYVVFEYQGDMSTAFQKERMEAFEVAHFRLLGDMNFLPYGRSIVEGARKTFKQLSLMEDAMLLHRIMRAPERRVYKIDIGNIAPDEVDAHVEQFVQEFKKVPYIDPQTGDYNLRFNLMNMMEDIIMPVRGGEAGTSVEVLPGLSGEGQLEDVEYIKNKMLASLKIPKAYLGFQDSEAKATLASEDIRFARTIERIQKIIVSELYKIALIHLKVQGFEDDDLLNFELSLNNPSLIYERQRVDLMTSQVDLVTNILEKRLFSRKYIYERIFGMSETEWKADQELVLEDLKTAFREEQIATEGNDPKLTGKSFGTPHDLAALHAASDFDAASEVKRMYNDEGEDEMAPDDERQDNPGRPEEPGTFETPKDQDFGRDPVGRKAAAKTPVGMESVFRALDRRSGKSALLKEERQRLLSELRAYRSRKNESVRQTLEAPEVKENIKMLDESSLYKELE
jgi:hypothetical protein